MPNIYSGGWKNRYIYVHKKKYDEATSALVLALFFALVSTDKQGYLIIEG